MYLSLVLRRFKFLNTQSNNNIDKNFKNIANEDFNLTKESLVTTVASVSTREIQKVDSISNNMFTNISIPEAYRIDAKPFIERPFYAGAVSFPNTAPRFSYLNTPIRSLPGDIIRSNTALLQAMKIATLYRSDLVLNISMAGTITHAGCILVAALPPLLTYPTVNLNNGKQMINTFLSSPHAFLHANEATSVNLTIPWYCNTDLATLTMDTTESTLDLNGTKGNYATLAFLVLNPLAPSTGSSTSLTIIIEACFKNLDILVPSPRFATWAAQSGKCKTEEKTPSLTTMTKNGLKSVTGDFIDMGVDALASSLAGLIGLHNPNNAHINTRMIMNNRNFQNVTDAEQFFEKLDPSVNYNRVMNSPLFGSDVDEMSISHITSKRQMLGSFQVNVNDAVGKLYWIRPISPFQGGIGNNATVVTATNNLELLHTIHRAWRGDLRIVIQSVMNNKQQCKLKLIKMYNPPANALTGSPLYQTVANAPSHLMEFTQGGQEHEIVLPFLSRNELMPCSEDQNLEAFLHGLYYIYLAQPLANSDGSPTTVEFNVYMVGEPNLTFYGYNSRAIRPFLLDLPEAVIPTGAPLAFKAQSGGEAIRVMNEPQEQQENIDRDTKQLATRYMDRLLPNFDIRPHLRRMYLNQFRTFGVGPAASNSLVISLDDVVAEGIYITRDDVSIPRTPTALLSLMYYSKSVGFKFFLEFSRNSFNANASPLVNMDIKIFYVPPGLTFHTASFTACHPFVNIQTNDSTSYCNLPLQIAPVHEDINSVCYEFVIPDVTFYKFMGSPNKLHPGMNKLPLSSSDFGNILIYATNSHTTETVTLRVNYSTGLTDESRMGHHSMAPVFLIDKPKSPYLDIASAPFVATKNSNIYKGWFL